MAGFAGPPMPSDPPTELGRLRILSKTAGIRVSPLALGGGNIGQAWNSSWGFMDKERAFELLDAYLEAGGNFIDTANTYQDGESEVWIGEWMAQRRIRDRLVIATKYTSDFGMYDFANRDAKRGQKANHGGNSRRSLHMSVRESLRRLQTDWIDILYVHWWDYTASIEEVVDSLHALVQQGKVLYLGVCNTPAWIVSAANTYAKAHGKTPFSVYSGKWSLLARGLEREIVPMARAFGMAIVPWGVLGQGKFQTDEAVEEREKVGEPLRPYGGGREVENERGAGRGCGGAWDDLSRGLVGGRKTEHLKDNIAALDIWLTEEQVAFERTKEFDIGYPNDFIGEDPHVTGIPGHMSATSAYLVFRSDAG
ncbi:hypothetical protein NEMBOFW57_005599 [Staphylotrichum longicolle]|uniref:NADP-dependent oxidoreductase domain-containing protein n=1 Tax=Staphylotrichum longicolle TaxID=669026 RepID=A0AAD4HW65_9PEZI|nr:hypothetical protein NEMBOFW57_005599 [Staphylotrichum longicolle]